MKIGPYLVHYGDSIFSFDHAGQLEKWWLKSQEMLGNESPAQHGGKYLGILVQNLTTESLADFKKLESLTKELEETIKTKKKPRRYNNRRFNTRG